MAALAYFFLALYRIDFQSIWYDEGLTLHYSSLPLLDGLRELSSRSVHPPLYFAGLHFWLRVAGDSDFAVRFPSAAFGALFVASSFLLGSRLADRWLGLTVAFLTATSPFLVYYGQEARMYTAVAFLSTLSAAGAIDIARNRRGYLSYAVVSSLAVLTHYFAILVLGSQVAIAAPVFALQRRYGDMAKWLGSLAVAGLAFSLWAVNFVRVAATREDFWRERLPLVDMAQDAFLHFSLGEVAWPGNELIVVFYVGAALGLLGVFRRRLRLAVLVAAATLTISFVAIAAFPKAAYVARYMLVVAPAYFLLIGAGIYNLATGAVGGKRGKGERGKGGKTWALLPSFLLLPFCPFALLPLLRRAGAIVSPLLAAILVLLLTGVNIVSLLNLYHDPASSRREDFKSLARFIEPLVRPGDAFVFVAGPLNYALFHYLPETAPFVWVDAELKLKPGDSLPQIDGLMAGDGVKRIWLVRSLVSADDLVDPERVSQKRVMDRFGVMTVLKDVRGLVVEAYDRDLYADFQRGRKLDIRFGDEVRLSGLDLRSLSLKRGGNVDVGLFWEPLRRVSRLLWVSLQIVESSNGKMIALDDFPAGGLVPTTTWQPGMRVADRAALSIPKDALAGDYDAYLVVYDPATGERFPVAGGPSGSLADAALLFSVRLAD